jgi:C_GCAxxG_C_C family probable redox protein
LDVIKVVEKEATGGMMMKEDSSLINERVHHYYWNEDLNCATTILRILAEIFEINLCSQTVNSAIGMHGAGGFGAQCGLVEGSLMFIGIFGANQGYENEKIVKCCYNFSSEFQKNFGSLVCSDLRLQGFKPDNPPHLCEELTKKAVEFTVQYIARLVSSSTDLQ